MKPRQQPILRGSDDAHENAESGIKLQRGGNEQEEIPEQGHSEHGQRGFDGTKENQNRILTQLTSMKLLR